MSDDVALPNGRHAAIVLAATQVFLRYGYKKTSMDDLARAAGLSRQGLYLHFATKEVLFEEAVLRVVALTGEGSKSALARTDLDVSERIVLAFEALHGHAIGQSWSANLAELMETAKQIVGPVAAEVEHAHCEAVARVLKSEGIAAAWKSKGISARELANHLYATSYGLKHRASTIAEYRDGMRLALKIVCSLHPK